MTVVVAMNEPTLTSKIELATVPASAARTVCVPEMAGGDGAENVPGTLTEISAWPTLRGWNSSSRVAGLTKR